MAYKRPSSALTVSTGENLHPSGQGKRLSRERNSKIVCRLVLTKVSAAVEGVTHIRSNALANSHVPSASKQACRMDASTRCAITKSPSTPVTSTSYIDQLLSENRRWKEQVASSVYKPPMETKLACRPCKKASRTLGKEVGTRSSETEPGSTLTMLPRFRFTLGRQPVQRL